MRSFRVITTPINRVTPPFESRRRMRRRENEHTVHSLLSHTAAHPPLWVRNLTGTLGGLKNVSWCQFPQIRWVSLAIHSNVFFSKITNGPTPPYAYEPHTIRLSGYFVVPCVYLGRFGSLPCRAPVNLPDLLSLTRNIATSLQNTFLHLLINVPVTIFPSTRHNTSLCSLFVLLLALY